MAVLDQPAYSPALAPRALCLLTKLEKIIKETRFQGVEAIKSRNDGVEETSQKNPSR